MTDTITLEGVPTEKYPNGVPLTTALASRSEVIKNLLEDMGGSVDRFPVGLPEDPNRQNNDDIAAVFEYLVLSDQRPQEKKEGEEVKPRTSTLTDWEKSFFDAIEA